MSILTFPSLVGSTWDIKKRQFWSTDIETSASGVEFRTAYWTKPIYEFDMAFSYLSQADMVTLQAFYASMQGPFGTFCLNVPNDGPGFSAAVPVFTGDGSTTSVVLPSAVGYVTNVSAMHRTDWQGRQLLYPTARTNVLTQSEFPNGLADTSTNGGNASAASGLSWNGGISTGIAFTSNSTSSYAYKNSTLGSTPATVTFSCVIKMDDGGAPVTGGNTTGDFSFSVNNAPQSADTIIPLAGGLYRCSRTIAYTGNNPNIGVVKYTTQSARTFVVSAYDLKVAPALSSYIKTGTQSATVTDYTVSSSGVVTLGQAPASGAVVDADLNYGYLVRFRDDNASTAGAMEINQMLNGMYEQTGLTFRTVR